MHYSELNYTKDDIILILLKYINYTSSSSRWDRFVGGRKKQVIPYSHDILKIMNVQSWEGIYQIVQQEWENHDLLKGANDIISKKDILNRAFKKMLIKKQMEPYKEELISSKSYARFREKHPELDLPHHQHVIRVFGSWNEFKIAMGLKTHGIGRRPKYTDKELIELLIKHKEYFTDAKTWNEYAEKYNLPKMSYMRNRIPLDIIQQYTSYGKRNNYTIPYLLNVINEHREAFMKGKTYWETYATEHQLPHYYTIVNKIGKQNTKLLQKGKHLTVEEIENNPF